jgi:hypothetical protein
VPPGRAHERPASGFGCLLRHLTIVTEPRHSPGLA